MSLIHFDVALDLSHCDIPLLYPITKYILAKQIRCLRIILCHSSQYQESRSE